MALQPKPGILDIAPYVGGRAETAASAHPVKLSSNENALGASPLAVEAYRAAADRLHIYPEGSARILREAIGESHGLDPARIVCGNGSDELLSLLAHAYLRPGDEALFSAHAFLVYRIAALANSARPVVAPEKELRVDVDAMLACATPRTRLVYLANPNNPTGSYLGRDEVRRLHQGLGPHVLLVIDAAYAEYVRRDDYEAGIELVASNDNVVMTRTFSKVYGLAGLRVGWAYCPPAVVDVLGRVRGPFNVSAPAQRASAAALKDRAHVEKSVAHNERWRAWLIETIRAAGFRVDDSVGNFVLIHFADPRESAAADDFLCARGLVLRGMKAYGLPHCLRLTVGAEDANRRVTAALAEFRSGR
ncbi:MAG: histidinol-phosphate transaminase [Alphaproteobacteria bacterium]|nr:histidinol-phosphate transaminase [Alphaproteobacteria bacterium]MBV9694838.1 histidinol-phosphate transaminase [Alphaproteobacteria bacterium]